MWPGLCRAGQLLLCVVLPCLAAGCATAEVGWREKLRGFGLEPLSDEEARLPPAERGRFVACRVIAGRAGAVLEAHPAGYLLVGVGRAPAADAEAIRRALEDWRPGEKLVVRVRRNPHLAAEAEWWEYDVELRHP